MLSNDFGTENQVKTIVFVLVESKELEDITLQLKYAENKKITRKHML